MTAGTARIFNRNKVINLSEKSAAINGLQKMYKEAN